MVIEGEPNAPKPPRAPVEYLRLQASILLSDEDQSALIHGSKSSYVHSKP